MWSSNVCEDPTRILSSLMERTASLEDRLEQIADNSTAVASLDARLDRLTASVASLDDKIVQMARLIKCAQVRFSFHPPWRTLLSFFPTRCC